MTRLLLLTGGLLLSCCWLLASCGDTGPELTFSPTELPAAEKGQPYRATLTVSDNDTPVGDLFVQSGALPPGLELTFHEGTDSAEISGTPTEAGTFEFVVEAWCFGTNVSGDTGAQAYTLVVE